MIPLFYVGVGLVLVYLVAGRTTANSIKDKEKAYNVLTSHSQIQGFSILAELLQTDNFLTDEPYKPPANIPATLTIGAGKGETDITNVDLFLRDLTADKLNRVTRKALRYDPRPDTVADRTQVLTWITGDIPDIVNYDLLVSNLNAINWISTTPRIPQGLKLDPHINFSAHGKTKKILNYPYFILHATADDILSMTNSILDPDDSTLEDREYTYLLAETGVIANITGFNQLVPMLDYNGFIKSPQQFNVPRLIPDPFVLGTYSISSKDLITIFKNGRNADLNDLIVKGLNSSDPTLKDRVASLATLKSVMNNFKGEPGYPGNFETVYNWLVTSGYVTSPRKFTPIPNPPQNFTARSFGWYYIADVNNWLETVDYLEVDKLNSYATVGSFYYTKYLAYKNCITNDLTYEGKNNLNLVEIVATTPVWGSNKILPVTPSNIETFANTFRTLYGSGLMYSPCRLPSNSSTFGFGTGKQLISPDDLNKDDSLLIDMWIGGDPAGVFGPLNTGAANPYYVFYANAVAYTNANNGRLILYGQAPP